MNDAAQPWVVLGVAASKRTRGLQAARARLGLAPAEVLEWRDWLAQPHRLEPLLQQACRFKIEPPGDDAQVHAQLLHIGCEQLGRKPCTPPEHGELVATDAWFHGFSVVMQQLARVLAHRPHVQVLNAPAEVLAMTDKLLCQQRLQAHAVPTPRLLGEVTGYEHFRAVLDQHGLDRVYLKARYGSSAAGVVAYRRNRRGQEQATTSAQLVQGSDGPRLFNVKRICSYTDAAQIRQVMDAVASQAAYAEAWVHKPRKGIGHFDLRVLTFGGRAAHRVARVGLRAMTNLHLDSQRANPDQLLTPSEQQLLVATVEHAAGAFARSHIIGFDVVVHRHDAHVLEANAFGDLLPGLLWQGHDPYATAHQVHHPA